MDVINLLIGASLLAQAKSIYYINDCLAYIISILRIFPLLLAALHVLLSVQFQLDAQVLAVHSTTVASRLDELGQRFCTSSGYASEV